MNYRSVTIGLFVFSSVCSAQFARKENEADDKQAEREEWFYTQRALSAHAAFQLERASKAWPKLNAWIG